MTITMALDLAPFMLLQTTAGPLLHRHFVFSEIEVTLLAGLAATPLECS
jgi:hypothetical protein